MLLGAVSVFPGARVHAESIEPNADSVVQQAEFWLWFSHYGDSDGKIFDPHDLDQLMQQSDSGLPNESKENIANMPVKPDSTAQGHTNSDVSVREEGI
ncbi:hypothetical protein R50072_21260 [Simiduia litorea]